MSNNIFIITRRQFEDGGIGTAESVQKIPIKECNTLWDFWLGLLVTKDSVQKILSNILSKEDCETGERDAKECVKNEDVKKKLENIIALDKISTREDIFDEKNFYNKNESNSPWDVKSEFLRRLFQNLNRNPQNKLSIDHLMNLCKVGNDIFVYHHWLDRWLSEQPSDKFIEAIRSDVIAKIENYTPDSFTLNWLVHDTDLGRSGTDGMIYHKGNIINENNPNFVENSILYDRENKKVKPDFAKDNFWIFIHTKGVNGYYDNYISKDISSANQLYEEISFSMKKLKHLAQVLKGMGFAKQGAIPDDNKALKDKLFKPFIDYYNFGVETQNSSLTQDQELKRLEPFSLSAKDFINHIERVLKL